MGQFLLHKLDGRFAQLDGLRDGQLKASRLLDQARRISGVDFRRIDQIQPKNILLLARAHVKAVAIIRRVRNQATILEASPILPGAQTENRTAKNEHKNQSALPHLCD